MFDFASSSIASKTWLEALHLELEQRESDNLLRKLQIPDGIDFASNDYLSLNSSGHLQNILQAISAEFVQIGSTASRLVRGHHPVFEKVESEFASFAGRQTALLFHSGYAANLGCLQALLNARDTVFTDRLSHASLLDGIRLSGARRHYFKHNDLNDLEDKLKRYPARRRAWIITESIFSMDGDSPDLSGLVTLAEQYGALIYLDEAHSLGLLGPHGAGLAAANGLARRIDVQVFPCGKAPGLMGAFVCGNLSLKSFLINHARSLIYSTAQPPLMACLLGQVIKLFQTKEFQHKRTALQKKASDLRYNFKELGYHTGSSTSQIVPLILGSEESTLEFAKRAAEAGLDLRAIRPPTVPVGSSRLRICLHSDHSPAEISRLLQIFAERQSFSGPY